MCLCARRISAAIDNQNTFGICAKYTKGHTFLLRIERLLCVRLDELNSIASAWIILIIIMQKARSFPNRLLFDSIYPNFRI